MQASHPTGRPIDPQLVEYLVVVVPDEAAAEVVLDSVSELAQLGLLSILDEALVSRTDGDMHFADPVHSRSRVVLEPSMLLTGHDLTLIGEAVEEGCIGVVLVVDDVWATPIARAARAVGGYVAGGERIPLNRVQAMLSARGVSRPES